MSLPRQVVKAGGQVLCLVVLSIASALPHFINHLVRRGDCGGWYVLAGHSTNLDLTAYIKAVQTRISLHVTALHEGEGHSKRKFNAGRWREWHDFCYPIWAPGIQVRSGIQVGSGERRSCCKSRRTRFLRAFVAPRALTVLLSGQVMV